MIFISAPAANFDISGRLTTLANASVSAGGRFVPSVSGDYRLTCATGASAAFTTTGTNAVLGGNVSGASGSVFLAAPTANFNASDELTSLTGCVLSTSQSITGLLGATSYRAVVLSAPSDTFAVEIAAEWVIVDTVIEVAPTPFATTTPVISGGILSGPSGIYRVVNSTLGTDTERSLSPPESLANFASPGDSLTIYHLQFSSQSPDVVLPDAAGLFEDWSWLTVGNTWTEVDARYTREISTVAATVVTDADAPSGKAVQWGVTSNAHRWARWDDMTTYLTGRTTETVQFLVLFRLQSTNLAKGGLGHFIASEQHTGIIAQRFGAASQIVYVQGNGAVGTTTNTATLGTYSDGDLIWVRAEVSGTTIKGRSWLKSAGEPGSGGEPTGWTTYTAGAALAFTTLGPTLRTGNPGHQILYYSAVLDGTAPGPA